MKKVLFVLASEDFRDSEYFVPAEILKDAGHKIFVASDLETGQTAFGADGGEVPVDSNISDANPADFDLLVFVGGPGALKHLDNEISYSLARKTIEAGKLLAAICISPVILAKAGALKDKKATVWSGPENRSTIKTLEENGARYVDNSVVVDKIITANGPKSAEEFGNVLKELLK